MSDNVTKLDLKDLQDKNRILRQALHDFLDEHQLSLSKQNFERAFQHLLACMHEHKNLSKDDVHRYLNEVLDYHEHTIDVMNKSGLAEDSLVKILVTADYETIIAQNAKPWKLSWRSLPMPVAVSLVLIIGAALAKPTFFAKEHQSVQSIHSDFQVITSSQEEEIKNMVQRLKEITDQSHMQIYSDLKDLPEIQALGQTRTYKKFNQAQFEQAIAYLKNEIAKTEILTD